MIEINTENESKEVKWLVQWIFEHFQYLPPTTSLEGNELIHLEDGATSAEEVLRSEFDDKISEEHTVRALELLRQCTGTWRRKVPADYEPRCGTWRELVCYILTNEDIDDEILMVDLLEWANTIGVPMADDLLKQLEEELERGADEQMSADDER